MSAHAESPAGTTSLTLRAAAGEFLSRPSPRIILPALAIAAAWRGVVGHWSWRDLVVLAAMVFLQPLAEWLTHAKLLHARPFSVRGRVVDLSAAREHREHHLAPADLDRTLMPWDAVLAAVFVLAAAMAAAGILAGYLLGGDALALALTAAVVAYALISLFEWAHFLIHTSYRPRGRYYRAIWRNHRLHHYQNERYWFGITSTVADRLLHSFPSPRSAGRSLAGGPASTGGKRGGALAQLSSRR